MFSSFPPFLKYCRSVTHSRLQHSLQHCESSTRCLWRLFRHQLYPDFDVSVRCSLCQSQTSSRGQCRRSGVRCVAQRSDEHGGVAGSRWNIRCRLRFCVLQMRHVLLVYKGEVVVELDTEPPARFSHRCRAESGLQPSLWTSAMFVIEALLRYHAQFLCVLIQ